MRALLFFSLLFSLGEFVAQNNHSVQQSGNHNIQVFAPGGSVTVNQQTSTELVKFIIKGIRPDLLKSLENEIDIKKMLDIIMQQQQMQKYLLDSLVLSSRIIEKQVRSDSLNGKGNKGIPIDSFSKDNPNIIVPVKIINNYAVVRKGEKYGLINDKGEEVIGIRYSYLGFSGNTNFIAVRTKDSAYYVNVKREKTLQVEGANRVYEFEGAVARVQVNNKYGLIDTNGKFITEPKFRWIDPFYNANAAYFGGEPRDGLISKEGKILIKPFYESMHGELFNRFGFFAFGKPSRFNGRTGTKYGFFVTQNNGNILLEESYGHPIVSSSKKGYFIFYGRKRKQRNEQPVLYDSTGTAIREYIKGSSARFLHDTLIRIDLPVKGDIRNIRIATLKDKTVFQGDYVSLEPINDSLYLALRRINTHYCYGLLDFNGIELLPFHFEKLVFYEKKYYAWNSSLVDPGNKSENHFFSWHYDPRSISSDNRNVVIFSSLLQCERNCDKLKFKTMQNFAK